MCMRQAFVPESLLKLQQASNLKHCLLMLVCLQWRRRRGGGHWQNFVRFVAKCWKSHLVGKVSDSTPVYFSSPTRVVANSKLSWKCLPLKPKSYNALFCWLVGWLVGWKTIVLQKTIPYTDCKLDIP